MRPQGLGRVGGLGTTVLNQVHGLLFLQSICLMHSLILGISLFLTSENLGENSKRNISTSLV